MPAFDFCKSLTVKVEVTEVEFAVPLNEDTPLAPSWQRRDEVVGAGELHVEFQVVLDMRDRFKKTGRLGLSLDVHVNGRGAPAVKPRR